MHDIITPTEVKEILFDETKIPVALINDEVWFSANQIAKVLELSNTTNLKRHLDEDEYMDNVVLGIKQADGVTTGRKVTVINESGVYAALSLSTSKTAKKFNRWWRKEVLPALREKGSYSMTLSHFPRYLIAPTRLTELMELHAPAFRFTYKEAEEDRQRRKDEYDKIHAEPGYWIDFTHKDVQHVLETTDFRRDKYRKLLLKEIPKVNYLYDEWKDVYQTFERVRAGITSMDDYDNHAVKTAKEHIKHMDSLTNQIMEVLEGVQATVSEQELADQGYLMLQLAILQQIDESVDKLGVTTIDELRAEHVYQMASTKSASPFLMLS